MQISDGNSDFIIWMVLTLSLLLVSLAIPGACQDDEDLERSSGMEEYFSGDDENTSQTPGEDREGSAEIPVDPSTLTTCQMRRNAASKQPGSFRPQCLPGGSFKPVQCHGSTGECWCVDSRGEEIPGTIQRAPASPTCSSVKATGCPDLAPPTNGWTERIEERVVVRCNHSHETWHLTCRGNTWIGTVANCSQVESPEISVTRKPFNRIPDDRQTEADDIGFESSATTAREPVVTDGRTQKPAQRDKDHEDNDEDEYNIGVTPRVYFRGKFLALFRDPLIFAGIVAGAVLALLVIVLLIMFTVYRMRKKDEGSYDLGKQEKINPVGYTRAKDQEFFA